MPFYSAYATEKGNIPKQRNLIAQIGTFWVYVRTDQFFRRGCRTICTFWRKNREKKEKPGKFGANLALGRTPACFS